jgi:DNA-binding MarR family transcriptional regulator
VNPSLDPDHPHTTYLIGRLDRIVRRALEERLRPHGVTLLGYTALTVLAVRPGLSNAQLARRSFMTPQGMNQAVAVLAERGLIQRSPDKDNRRRRRIELTAAGRRVVDSCTAAVEEYEQILLAALGPDAREQLRTLLQTVVEANRQRPVRSSPAVADPPSDSAPSLTSHIK